MIVKIYNSKTWSYIKKRISYQIKTFENSGYRYIKIQHCLYLPSFFFRQTMGLRYINNYLQRFIWE